MFVPEEEEVEKEGWKGRGVHTRCQQYVRGGGGKKIKSERRRKEEKRKR